MTKIGDLEKRLKAKIEETEKEITDIEKKNLENFEKRLEKIIQNALNTTRKDIAHHQSHLKQSLKLMNQQIYQDTQTVRRTTVRMWLPIAIAYSSCLIILLGGGIGWMKYLASQTKEDLKTQESARKRTEAINQKTWGVSLLKTDNGRFVVLPPDYPEETKWICSGQPCIKLGD